MEKFDKNEKNQVLLSVKDLVVKFHVRGRILTAIRNINLDIYENESIAIVGESGSGKSVFTKTFAGMLDSNGFIDNGSIIYNDPELSQTNVVKTSFNTKFINYVKKRIDKYAKYKLGSEVYNEINKLDDEFKQSLTLSDEEKEAYDKKIDDLVYERTELYNYKQTLDTRKDKEQIASINAKMKEYDNQIIALQKEKKQVIKDHKKNTLADKEKVNAYKEKRKELEAKYKELISGEISEEQYDANLVVAKEVELSIGRYDFFSRMKKLFQLLKEIKKAYKEGIDNNDDEAFNKVFGKVVFRVKLVGEDEEKLYGYCVVNLASVKYSGDWQQIRGKKIATVFQDPMTSLNPVIPIGKQISSIIMKHQKVSEVEARKRAVELMMKVGIPDAENRYEDYPFQYSGGMRQRIVIAIALSCQPKILICDEPTTALDVTIQAQILKLIKDLQKEFNYTIVFITHDLGVVANVADRVAVLYAGQIVEVGKVNEIYYDPRHPYTWALLSSLPQLAEKDTELFSIQGTPPSLYNKIVGDPFAPRNKYCMKIDTLMEPPMFKVSETHYAKTWLLDPRSPKVEKPEIINNIHNILLRVFNITEDDTKKEQKEVKEIENKEVE